MRYDGMQNVMNGVGTRLDPTTAYALGLQCILTDQELTNWFEGSKIAENIISKPADACVKSWISIKGDVDNLVYKDLNRLNSRWHFSDAIRWMRLYGMSGILMNIDDGRPLEEEVDEKNVRSIDSLRVFDKKELWYHDAGLYNDPTDKRYGTPEIYYIQPVGGMPFYVHESRMLIFHGDNCTNEQRVRRNGAGRPTLQGMTEDIRNYQQAYHNMFLLLERKQQLVFKMPNLSELVSTTEGEERAVKRMHMVDMSRHILNMLTIDGVEELESIVTDLAHVAETLDQFGLKLTEDSQIPYTVLFGRSPAGENATGESDLENWYSFVAQIQERHIRNPIERLIYLSMIAKDGSLKGQRLEEWAAEFKPLWEPSEKEEAETCKLHAEAKKARSEELKNYVDSGLIADVEGRKILADEEEFKDYIDPSLDISPEPATDVITNV